MLMALKLLPRPLCSQLLVPDSTRTCRDTSSSKATALDLLDVLMFDLLCLCQRVYQGGVGNGLQLRKLLLFRVVRLLQSLFGKNQKLIE